MADDLFNALQSAGHSSSVLGAIANPAQVNVLGAYAGAAKTAGEIYNVQDLQAQKAWGEALQQSTGPDGVTDYQKASAIAAGNPLAAMGMMKGLHGSTELSGAVQDQGLIRNKAITDMQSATLNVPDDQLHDAVLAGTQKLINAGFLTPAQAHKALLNMSNDPTQLRAQIERNRIALLPPGQQEGNLYGTTYNQNVGGAIQSGTQAPASRGGGQQPTTAISTGPSPEQLAAPFSYTDPDTGQPVTEPYGDFLKRRGFALPGGGGAQPGTKGLPDSLRNPANKAAPTSNAPAPASNAPAPAALPPPAPTAPQPGMAEKWKASADQYTADTAASGQYQQRIFPLVQSRALLESGDVTTGQGAEAVQRLKGMLGTVAGQMGWNPNQINNAKFEELNKYLTQYTNGLPMAGASDARLASAITGNPSAHISTMANKDVVKALIGLERMKQTAITDFAATGGQPKDYADYLRTWQNTHDPRAFVFDMMDADARKKMVAGMKTDTERQAFARTLDLVERNPGVMGQAAMPGR